VGRVLERDLGYEHKLFRAGVIAVAPRTQHQPNELAPLAPKTTEQNSKLEGVGLGDSGVVPVRNRGKLFVDDEIYEDASVNYGWGVLSATVVGMPMVHWRYITGMLEICRRLSEESEKRLSLMGCLPWNGGSAKFLIFIDKVGRKEYNPPPCKQGLVVACIHNSLLKPLKRFRALSIDKRNIDVEDAE